MAKFKKSARIISARDVDEWEAKLRAAVSKCLDAQVGTINHKLRAAGLPGALTAAAKPLHKKPAAAVAAGAIAVPMAWSQSNWTREVNQTLGPVAEDVAIAAAGAAVAGLGFAAIAGAASSVDSWITQILNMAIGSGQAIGDRVDAAGIAGANVPDAIQAVLDTSDSILGNVVGAMGQAVANAATLEQANAVISYGAPSYLSAQKTWNTQEDDKVRPDHEDADGQEVNINDTFQVGGEDMTGPGDDSASIEQTINCRCFLTYDGLVPAGTEDQFQDETKESGLANAAAGG